MKIQPVKRPQGQPGVPQIGNLDPKVIEKWARQFAPNMTGRGPWQWRSFGPGVVLGEGESEKLEFPKGLSISVVKSGDEPAKIVVKQGDKTWETTEQKIDELPEEIRPHVKRLLGRNATFDLHVEPFKWAPETRDFHRRPRPHGESTENIEERMQRQMDQMRRTFEQLRQDMEQLQERRKDPKADKKPNGAD